MAELNNLLESLVLNLRTRLETHSSRVPFTSPSPGVGA
jgi:hypothetical protein